MTKATGPNYRVYFRRRREGKTNFAKRLALIKSRKTRMVVRKSNVAITVQFINFAPPGDQTIVTVSSANLAKLYSWPAKRNVYSAYLTGLYAGKQAQKKQISEFVLDLGLYEPTKGSVLFATLQGAVDAGLKTSFDPEMVPRDKLASPPEKLKSLFVETKKQILML